MSPRGAVRVKYMRITVGAKGRYLDIFGLNTGADHHLAVNLFKIKHKFVAIFGYEAPA